MTDLKYDQVVQIDIGRTAADCATITNVLYFAEKPLSPDNTDLLEVLAMINTKNPEGVHQFHKYWMLEMALDTDWYIDDANKDEYWSHHQHVDAADTLPAIVDDGDNTFIEYMVVRIREHDGTYTKLTYADVDTNVLMCINEKAAFNNETGTRNQPKTFQFICLQERIRAADVAPTPAAGQGAAKVKRINKIRTGGVDCVNVLGFEEEHVMKMTPQFVPNTFQGVGIKQDEKWRKLAVIVDSETSIFDSMLEIIAANDPAGTDFLAVFTMDDGIGTTETWTYQPTKVYMSNRPESRINAESGRKNTRFEFVTYGTKLVSQP